MEKIFLNDHIVDLNDAKISAIDAGFLYGAGLFETMRCTNNVVFALADHLDRLFFSAEKLSIKTYDRKYLTEAVYRTLRANELSEARLRLTISNGSMSAVQQTPSPTVLITATNMRGYPAEYYQKGVMVTICPYRQNPFDPLCGHKTTSYFSRMLGLKDAHRKKAAETLWFTTDNRLAEGCISNVFVVKNSVVYTPPLRTPVLAGVARKTVFQIAGQNSLAIEEKDLYINDVFEADEIFITNVIMQIMPVTTFERHLVGTGSVGPITQKMQKLFARFVQKQCGLTK